MKHSDKSILDRIKAASNTGEIDDLLQEGRGFQQATDSTRRKWKRMADKRRTEVSR